MTMGHRALNWDEWIQLDSYFPKYHGIKSAELQKDFAAHVQYVDNAVTRQACHETYEEIAPWLVRRYPKLFEMSNGFVTNLMTGDRFPYPAGKCNRAAPAKRETNMDTNLLTRA